jgi:hypothetical protein
MALMLRRYILIKEAKKYGNVSSHRRLSSLLAVA